VLLSYSKTLELELSVSTERINLFSDVFAASFCCAFTQKRRCERGESVKVRFVSETTTQNDHLRGERRYFRLA
jgi:hypothetical protein